MEIKDALHLIEAATIETGQPQQWADLGCGSGTFTRALAHILPTGSTIDAVDRTKQQLPEKIGGVNIIFSQHDFENDPLPLPHPDGIILANALHYCRDSKRVLQRLALLQHPGREQFIVVEYDSTSSSRWVPYPLSFEKTTGIFIALGFQRVTKLGEHSSVFRREKIYACQALR